MKIVFIFNYNAPITIVNIEKVRASNSD